MRLTGCQRETDRQAIGIDDCVNLAGQSASRPTHELSVAGDAGPVLMHADNRRIDHLHGCVMTGGQRVHDPVPDARPSPANEAIVAGGVWAKVVRQIAPRRARTQDPKDAIEHAPVIYTRNAARLVRQERLDGGPFIIGEFVAHDSRLRFGSLNHASGDAINPQRPITAEAIPRFYFRFRGHTVHRSFLALTGVGHE